MILFLKNNWFRISVFNIIVIYIVGICGICCTNLEEQKLFLQLTPINLLVTTVYAFVFHKNWNFKFVCSLIFIFLFGFFIEVIGVKTQAVFGTYNYGKTLGFKVFDVPLMMGFNWLLLIYCIATSLSKMESAAEEYKGYKDKLLKLDSNGRVENKFATIILIIQFLFFGILNFILK